MALLPFDDDGDGEALKIEGMSRALRGAGLDYQDSFEKAVRQLAKSGQPFTADDVTKLVGFPRNHRTNANNSVGAMMSACANRGIIYSVGYKKAGRSLSHARMVQVWKGTR